MSSNDLKSERVSLAVVTFSHGDGETDIAVYRAGFWFMQSANGNVRYENFGTGADCRLLELIYSNFSAEKFK